MTLNDLLSSAVKIAPLEAPFCSLFDFLFPTPEPSDHPVRCLLCWSPATVANGCDAAYFHSDSPSRAIEMNCLVLESPQLLGDPFDPFNSSFFYILEN